MDRCPACRARLADGPVCPRCGCDYSLANRAEIQARRLTRRAVRAWAEGDPATATACIDESLALRRERLAEALVGVLSATAEDRRSERVNPIADQGDELRRMIQVERGDADYQA